MSTTEYRNQTEPGGAGDVFRTLIFYETSRFQKDFQTGKYLSTGTEERSFVASLADAADEVVVIAQCRLLQPEALPGEIEAYGKPVIQIDCVYEEPESVADGAAEVLISALPGVVKDLYGLECRTLIFQTYYERTLDWEPECDVDEKSFKIGIDDPREFPFLEFVCSFQKTDYGYTASITIIRIDREIYHSDMIKRLVKAIPSATEDMYGLRTNSISLGSLFRIGGIESRDPKPDRETVIRQIREACGENGLAFIEERIISRITAHVTSDSVKSS